MLECGILGCIVFMILELFGDITQFVVGLAILDHTF